MEIKFVHCSLLTGIIFIFILEETDQFTGLEQSPLLTDAGILGNIGGEVGQNVKRLSQNEQIGSHQYQYDNEYDNAYEEAVTSKNIRSSSNNARRTSNNIGSASNNLGSASYNAGKTSNNIGSASNNIRSASNNIGRTSNNLGSASNNLGSASNNVGRTSNNIGRTSNNIGRTSNNIGSASNNIRSASNNVRSVSRPKSFKRNGFRTLGTDYSAQQEPSEEKDDSEEDVSDEFSSEEEEEAEADVEPKPKLRILTANDKKGYRNIRLTRPEELHFLETKPQEFTPSSSKDFCRNCSVSPRQVEKTLNIGNNL